ncbi:hypothetical protein TRV_04218, partial [Trichophyton verrucosum HKI 0517]
SKSSPATFLQAASSVSPLGPFLRFLPLAHSSIIIHHILETAVAGYQKMGFPKDGTQEISVGEALG